MAIYFRPYRSMSRAPELRLDNGDEAIIAFLSQRTGIAIEIDPSVDYEEWMEPACILEQAIRMNLEIVILDRLPLHEALENPLAYLPGNPCPNILIGRILGSDLDALTDHDIVWPQQDDHINHYAQLDAFARHAGRRIQLADMPGDPANGRSPMALKGALCSMALEEAMVAHGARDVFVKQVWPAKSLPTLRFAISNTTTASQARRMFLDEVGFHFARYEGDKACLLVQDDVEMFCETRFMVINGKVATGAACIEEHTPIDCGAWDRAFDPIWEMKRGGTIRDERPFMERKKTAFDMWAFAQNVANDITAECPDFKSYSLDVAIGDDGQFLVIELNPASNCGLYATNTAILLQAILDFAQQ